VFTAECPMRELAAMSVLGALTDAESSALNAHLAQGCDACQQEIRMAGEIGVGLGEAVATDPPASLRDKLLSSIKERPPVPGVLLHEQGIFIARPDELPWRQLAPGVEVKLLHRDTVRRYQSVLLRIAPGASLYRHHHPEAEEVFVLSGDVSIFGKRMFAGDYCHAEADSIHPESYSECGCVMFIVASMGNHPVT
jgi:anti-sigma factor ChrR (cupin superfamily)